MRTTVAAAALVVLLAGCSGSGDDVAGCDFDTEEWVGLDATDDDQGARKGELAGIVVDCGLLDDATRAETAQLLGEGGAADATSWEYMTRPTMIDFELLVVDFGPGDTVTRVYVSQS
ncbi:hypothetical protein E1212_09555 [Jiangella ureilytica]|uniref:Lipoprotein n=1 Tax=Jiangella ureilytica TaxID=2530374 RepID=A0A4R4RQU0_9ACTN|nr:hypothetical protein [Jiangella ureilytica]TDC52288.1 hypothetical protein E1212_09555 [Jiangella ureilytica]